MVTSSLATLFLGLATLSAAQKVVFDGRVPSGTALTFFDSKNALYDSSNVFGKGLSWSKILKLPKVEPSLFDAGGSVPFEVTISDQSIFAPSETNVQKGFRRAELIPASNSGSDPSTAGVKGLHFSVMKDSKKPLNESHEYQLVFLESKDFSTNQVVLKTGTIIGQSGQAETLTLFGNVNKGSKVLHSTKFTPDVFHNYGLVLDFDKNTVHVHYSEGPAPLKSVGEPLPNDLSGQGQYHFGMLKKPVNAGSGDLSKSGEQPTGIDEGVVYGGIFLEEVAAGGSISLSATKPKC